MKGEKKESNKGLLKNDVIKVGEGLPKISDKKWHRGEGDTCK